MYYQHRVGRMKGSPSMIAAGFACGVAASFTPLIGLHFILAFTLALIVRGSFIASVFGTFIGNPWTFPFIWVLIYKLGILIAPSTAVDPTIMENVAIGDMLFTEFTELREFFIPMFIGSIPAATVAGLISYRIVRKVVTRYQARRFARLERKAFERAEKKKEKQQKREEKEQKKAQKKKAKKAKKHKKEKHSS